MKRLILAMLALASLIPARGSDINAVVDSALIMADDYATALSQNPQMAPTRLNALRNFGNAKPAEVRDSICSRLYDFFVSYTEENKADHAKAFRECFMALAGADNPNLGPLYATELAMARGNTDTTTIKKYIPLLEEYATRLGYDYDDELDHARSYLHNIRTRRPIREAIAGVWVSEDVAGFPKDDSNYIEKTDFDFVNKMSGEPKNLSRKVVVDENAYSIYSFWGDERLKRGDPEISAIVRQSVQATQASVAGQLSRSKYDFSTRLAGNLASGMVAAGINAIVDGLMVSKDRIWSVETTLHMVNPYCLEAELFATLIESRSDSPKPNVSEYRHKTRYYRWEKDDNVTFVGTSHRNVGQPWTMYGSYYLHGVTKEEMKAEKEKRKRFENEYKIWYNNEKDNYDVRLKALTKDSDEYNELKQEFKAFKDYAKSPKAWMKWNRESLDKLKAKSDNYQTNQ